MLPTRLELKNFRSHSHSVIDFDFSSALITGEKSGDPRRSNGAGKSGLLEALSFALFSETGDKNSDDIVKKGQIACEVTLDFTHDNQSYQVKRIRNAKYSKVITEFYQILEDGSTKKLHGDTNKVTDAILCDIIKCNYDVFLNSVYFRQGSFFDFTQGTFSTRQALLGSLLNLEDWGKYQKSAKQNFDKLEGEIQSLRNQLLDSEQAGAQLILTEESLRETSALIDSITKEIHKIESEISAIEEAIAQTSESSKKGLRARELKEHSFRINKDIENLLSVREEHERALKELNSSLESANNSVSDKTQLIQQLVDEISASDSVAKAAELSRMESALVEGKAKVRQVQTQIQTLSSGDSCSTCGHVWNDPTAKQEEISHKNSELETIQSKIQRAEAKLFSVKSEIDGLEKKSFELKKLRYFLDSAAESTKTIELRISALRSKRVSLEEESLALEQKLGGIKAELQAIESAGTIDVEDRGASLSSKKQELRSQQSLQKDLFIKSGQLSAQIEAINKTLAGREKAMGKLSECTKQAVIYSRLTKAFGRDGVQAIIIDNVVDELTRTTNQWLMEFSSEPMHVSFVTQKQSSKGEWKETFDIEINTKNGPQPWSSLSGGEKFIVSFAIRLSLGSIRARRMGGETQLLLLDEVSSSLDPYNIEVFVSIIRKLERTMKVLVITHDPALKDEFDTVLTVKKDDGGSYVERE